MTAAPAVSQAVSGGDKQLLTALQEIHRAWLQEARNLLDSAQRPEAGIHCRWRAVQYLNTIVSHRFELERTAVESLGQTVEAESSRIARLWPAAELVATLLWQLDHELGLCHRANEFCILTHKFEKAMVHWCGAVEDALGRLSWGDIPEQARRRLALLGAQEVHHDG